MALVEQPARLALDDRAALAQWQPSYARGAAMQGGLAMLSFVLGLAAAWQLEDWRWLAGAALILLPWPWTLIVIMPTNRRLKATAPAQANAETRLLLRQWGRLHLVRVALGLAASAAYLWVLVRGPTRRPARR